MPKISIVVPVYKVEEYLSRCVESILSQTYNDFELILVDDGSPDDSGKICDGYADRDTRVKVIHQKNAGLSAARNAGIEWTLTNSNSEWISFIDSDDWIHPRYLELLLNAAIETQSSVSICAFIKTENDEPDIAMDKFNYKLISTQEFFINNNVNAVIACAKLYKKDAFSDIRFPIGKLHEDEFTTHKVLFKYENISFIEAGMYYYYINPESIMNSNWSPKRLVILDAIKSQREFFKERNMTNVYNFCIKKYILCLDAQIMNIKKSNNTELEKTYLPKLEKELRKYLKKQNKRYRLTLREYPWIYEKAYPNLMNIYWTLRSAINKIRK